jgi:hypothetical protein
MSNTRRARSPPTNLVWAVGPELLAILSMGMGIRYGFHQVPCSW